MLGWPNGPRVRAVVNLPALYVEAWTAPRQSMRRILSLNLAERDRLIMVAITGVLFAIPFSLVMRTMELPPMPDGTPTPTPGTIEVAIMVVGMVILSYYISAMLLKAVGGLFGGKASYVECKTTSAWMQFVVGLANLVLIFISMVVPVALWLMLRLILMLGALYVASSFIAETQGFSSVGKVAAVLFGISFVFALLLISAIPMAPV